MPIRSRKLFLFFIPMTLILLFTYLLPICNVFYNTFFYNATTGDYQFIRLDNFLKIRSEIWPTIYRTLVWTFGSILPAMLLGLVFALLCLRSFRLKKLIISVGILPYTVPLVIVAVCWLLMYQPDFGLINVILLKLGWIKGPIVFLSRSYAMASVIVARVWKAIPFVFLNYYAALTAIPDEYYEAADVDGANSVKKFFRVTLPQLVPVTATTVIILTVWTFLVFDIIFTMTGGGPGSATKIITLQIHREIFNMNDMGTASAWSLIAIVLLIILTTFYWKISGGGKTE